MTGRKWPDPAIGNCIPIAAVDRKSMQMVSVRSGRAASVVHPAGFGTLQSFQRRQCPNYDGPVVAGLSQGGVQVGRRKPVIQGGPAREILSESPSAGCGRVREVTNGSFGAAKLVESLCA